MATRHPPFPRAPKDNGDPRFIWAYCALKLDASASRLNALHTKAMTRTTTHQNGNEEALWQGFFTVNEQARGDYREAKLRGELLFAWHGTKATEVTL